MNEIKVTGVAKRRANDVREVLQMVQANRILVKDLVTQEYQYGEINRAFEDLEHGRNLMGVTLWS